MELNDRQESIISYLKENKRASVKKLSANFYVSEMTIRRDLKELEKQGYIQRYSGGAVYNSNEAGALPISARMLMSASVKRRLAEKAKKYIKNGLTVFLDSSSTCSYLIPLLAEYKNITVITNSILTLHRAAEYHIPCILAGGDYYEYDMCTVGSVTESFLSKINPDLAFFSVLGLSDDGIITDCDLKQTAIRIIVMKNCRNNIFLFDSTRISKKYPYTICNCNEVTDVLII